MDIYLVRHGEAASSWSEAKDPGLSELGLQQARDTAGELASGLDAGVQLISSPMLRARETATPLAETFGILDVAIDEAFREIPSPVPMAERQTWLRGFMQQQWGSQPESLLQWRALMMDQLLALQQPTVIFTHFLVLNAVVGLLQERSETLCYWPDNASVTHLQHTGSELKLVGLGRQMSTVVN